MALQHYTVLKGIEDAGIYALTADTVSALTYGAKVDITGIEEITITMESESSEIKGDDVVIDSRGKIQKATVKVRAARFDLDVWGKVFGSSTVDAGTTPNQTATLTISGSDTPPKFKIAGRCRQVDAGIADVHFTIFKCSYTGGGEVSLQTDEYAELNFEADAVVTINNNKIVEVIEHETLTALPA